MDIRIASFLDRVAAVKGDRKSLGMVCREEMQAIDRDYHTEDGRRVRMTAYRNAMKAAKLPKYMWSQLHLPKKRSRQLRPLYDEQVATKGENQQPIYHYETLIEKAIVCLESPSYSAVLLGLCLLSGRRPVELCVTGDFCEDEVVEGQVLQPGEVWFSGQAKTRDEEISQTPYAIPLLCEVPLFMDAWKRFLTMKDFSTYEPETPGQEVSHKFKALGKTFGEAYNRYFAAFMPANTTVRHLRDAYALIAYHTCRPVEPHIAINLYLRKILGHSDSKGQTAQSYQKFYLADFARPQWGE